MSAIRRATSPDLEPLLALVRAFYAIDGHPYDEAVVRAGLAPLLDDDAHGQVWVVTDETNVLEGYAVVTWSWSLESGGRDAIVDELYVERRDRGTGSLLLRHALDAAETAGALVVFLETEARNGRVRRFYERHGFVADDSVWMRRVLDRDAAADQGA